MASTKATKFFDETSHLNADLCVKSIDSKAFFLTSESLSSIVPLALTMTGNAGKGYENSS